MKPVIAFDLHNTLICEKWEAWIMKDDQENVKSGIMLKLFIGWTESFIAFIIKT